MHKSTKSLKLVVLAALDADDAGNPVSCIQSATDWQGSACGAQGQDDAPRTKIFSASFLNNPFVPTDRHGWPHSPLKGPQIDTKHFSCKHL